MRYWLKISIVVIVLSLFTSFQTTQAASWYWAAGKAVLLLFGKGFLEGAAHKLGESAVERFLLEPYPPPEPREKQRTYRTQSGEILRYELIDQKGNKPVWKVSYSGSDFWCEDSALDDYSKYYLGCPGY